MSKSPFKFLDSYTKEDKDIFFGRDREIEEMYQKVFESKMLLVYGISGTGKTSLINCGLANKFEDSDWLPVSVRRGRSVVESLWRELGKVSISEDRSEKERGGEGARGRIIKTLQSVYLDHFKPIYLIFDQFEELFIFGDREEREEFIQIVKAVVNSDVQCRFIFSIREEYLAGVTEFERLIPEFLANRMRIEKMTSKNAIQVIEGPCKVQNIAVEEGFPEALLQKLNPDSNEVELTYLQVFLDKAFRLAMDKNKENPGFTNNILLEIGDVSDLLGSFLEEQISALEYPETGLTILKSFVSIKGTKRQVTLEDVSDFATTLGKEISEEELKNLIIKFVNLRILTGKDESGRYELRHDSLATKIYEKITLVEKEMLEVRQFIDNAYSNFKKRGIPLNREDLTYIATYEERLFLKGELSEFIAKCRNIITAKKRNFNRILRFSAFGFFFIIFAVVFYYIRSSSSVKSEKLALEASLQKDFNPGLSFNTALKAYGKDTTYTLAVKALFDAFYGLLENGPYFDSLGNELFPQKAIFDFEPCQTEILSAKFSDDGEYIYGYLADNTVKVWKRNGAEIFSEKENDTSVIALNFAPDNSYIAAVFIDSTANVWSLDGELICSIKVYYEPLNPSDVISFSSKKGIFSNLTTNNRIQIRDSTGHVLYELDGHKAPVNGAVFSPDSNYIASASKDSTVIIWHLDSVSGNFEKFNILDQFNNVVWSVDFAENSKYVLCASTDTSSFIYNLSYVCYICDLIGKKKEGIIFARYDTAYLNKFPSDSVRYARDITGEVVSARFSVNDAAIIVTCLNEKKPTINDQYQPLVQYSDISYRIELSPQSLWKLMAINKIVKYYYRWKMSGIIHNYDGIDLSAIEYISSNISGSQYTYLFHWDRLPIGKFRGTSPNFSFNGKYLLCIDGKSLRLYPSDEKELIRLAKDELIFGEFEKNIQGWLHYFTY